MAARRFYVFESSSRSLFASNSPRQPASEATGRPYHPNRPKFCGPRILGKSYAKTPEMAIKELTTTFRKAIEIRNAFFEVFVDGGWRLKEGWKDFSLPAPGVFI
jgi:hypothetical protein